VLKVAFYETVILELPPFLNSGSFFAIKQLRLFVDWGNIDGCAVFTLMGCFDTQGRLPPTLTPPLPRAVYTRCVWKVTRLYVLCVLCVRSELALYVTM